jgi:hypothetical protein
MKFKIYAFGEFSLYFILNVFFKNHVIRKLPIVITKKKLQKNLGPTWFFYGSKLFTQSENYVFDGQI